MYVPTPADFGCRQPYYSGAALRYCKLGLAWVLASLSQK